MTDYTKDDLILRLSDLTEELADAHAEIKRLEAEVANKDLHITELKERNNYLIKLCKDYKIYPYPPTPTASSSIY